MDAIYGFFTHAVDMAGREEILKNEADPHATTIYDTTPPSSTLTVPRYTTGATIANLSCAGLDNVSGIASMRLYYKFGLGAFACRATG
jgi:hypothetical protein